MSSWNYVLHFALLSQPIFFCTGKSHSPSTPSPLRLLLYLSAVFLLRFFPAVPSSAAPGGSSPSTLGHSASKSMSLSPSLPTLAPGLSMPSTSSLLSDLLQKEPHLFSLLPHHMTTQVLGYEWAAMLRRYLVEPAAMWWPYNLVQVSLFRALHEREERQKGHLTRNQFFLIAFISSFAYYIFPGYLFKMLTLLSWICWVFPDSVLDHQLGSGMHGLGVATIGLDWSAICAYLDSPLASPWFATANIAIGFFLLVYVITVGFGSWENNFQNM